MHTSAGILLISGSCIVTLPAAAQTIKATQTTTTTTTSALPPPAGPLVETAETVYTGRGTVTDTGADEITVLSSSSPQPLRYLFNTSTVCTDEQGNQVPLSVLKTGLPVTVAYTKIGGVHRAARVVVKLPVPVPPVTRTTVTETVPPAPVSTTVVAPVPAPMVREKVVETERPALKKHVEREEEPPAKKKRVVKEEEEAPVKAPLEVEKKTTTTTTTRTVK